VEDKDIMIRRFDTGRRIEHLAAMLLVLLLILTGLLQIEGVLDRLTSVVLRFGGVDRIRLLHRLLGILITLLVLWHGIVVASDALRGGVLSMIPGMRDLRDAVSMIKYWLWLSDERSRFDRYDYRQKFEYWALLINGAVMIASGFILLFPIPLAAILPPDAIPAAKTVHAGPGLAALCIVIAWHLVNAHLRPEIFPMDRTIFTGTISRVRMEKEHPVELERIELDAKREDR
jgi:formate dehydrogenase subunit gamma